MPIFAIPDFKTWSLKAILRSSSRLRMPARKRQEIRIFCTRSLARKADKDKVHHERSKQGKSLADLLSVHLVRFTSERTVNFRYSTTVRLYSPSGPASRHFHHFRYVQQYCGFLDHVQKFTDSCNARNIPYCFFSQDLRSKIPGPRPGYFDLRK